MKIWFHEIKDEDLNYEFDENQPWVMDVVGALDERVDRISRPANWRPRSRPTRVQFQIRRLDELIHVNGKIETQLFLLCSACADAFPFVVRKEFNSLYTMNEEFAKTQHEKGRQTGESKEDSVNDQMDDFEITLLEEAAIDLKDILNEQVVLTVPMQPKPPVKANGDCEKCGKPQVPDSFQEAPLKENPFDVLKNWKKPQ